jgi:hypothetical protein
MESMVNHDKHDTTIMNIIATISERELSAKVIGVNAEHLHITAINTKLPWYGVWYGISISVQTMVTETIRNNVDQE